MKPPTVVNLQFKTLPEIIFFTHRKLHQETGKRARFIVLNKHSEARLAFELQDSGLLRPEARANFKEFLGMQIVIVNDEEESNDFFKLGF